MKTKGITIAMFDAPDTPEFLEWAHGKHMRDCGKAPGVVRIRRHVVTDGPADRRRFLSITEYEDLDAALVFRGSEQGRLMREDADNQGVTNRYTLTCREIFDITFPKGG
jgi:hypothetical protein